MDLSKFNLSHVEIVLVKPSDVTSEKAVSVRLVMSVEDASAYLMELARDHYWDSLESQKDLIFKHLERLVAMATDGSAQKSGQADLGACTNPEGHHYIIGGMCEFCAQPDPNR